MQQGFSMSLAKAVPVLQHFRNQDYCSRCNTFEISKGTDCISYAALIQGPLQSASIAAGVSTGEMVSTNFPHEFERGPIIA